MMKDELRPSSFNEFIGNETLKENLKVYIASAQKRKDVLDHILFCGGPGLGKTSLSNIIAKEIGRPIYYVMGPDLKKAIDLKFLFTLPENTIVFIDEIHAISKVVEETLYPMMEDFKFSIGEGEPYKMPKFTIIGATTKEGNLSRPLRDRFGIIAHLNPYSDQDMRTITARSSKILNLNIDQDAIDCFSSVSRGIPRVANHILRRVRDFVIAKDMRVVTLLIAKVILRSLEIDEKGLTNLDRAYLKLLKEDFKGGPAGVKSLSCAMTEERDTVEEVIEPYLMKLGYMVKTFRGRCITDKALEYLK